MGIDMNRLVDFAKSDKNGYMILGNRENDLKRLIVKADDFLLAYDEGDSEIHVMNVRLDRELPVLAIEFRDDVEVDLEGLGEELCEWYFEGEGQQMLLLSSIKILTEKDEDRLERALDEALVDLDNIVDRVVNEYLDEKIKRYK